MSSLTIRGVAKSFGALRAVDGVDLFARPGSVTAVLGPSGCGKTTLLRMIAGFLRPDEGTISFGDTVVAGPQTWVPPQTRRVGYVPQEGALFPHLSVADNIAFGLARGRRRKGHVSAMLDLVELPASYATRQPHELSGGQQQRVALARALAPEPALVLLDEPFSSLDAGLRDSTGRAVVRALAAAEATAILVTHDQDEALSLTEQVAVMRAGKVIQAAPPRELYQSPADAEVARFVGGALLLPAAATRALLGPTNLVSGDLAADSQVLIRPEQIRLTSNGPGPSARVEEVRYYGHDASVRLSMASVEQGAVELLARVTGYAVPEVGDEVNLSVIGPVTAMSATTAPIGN